MISLPTVPSECRISDWVNVGTRLWYLSNVFQLLKLSISANIWGDWSLKIRNLNYSFGSDYNWHFSYSRLTKLVKVMLSPALRLVNSRQFRFLFSCSSKLRKTSPTSWSLVELCCSLFFFFPNSRVTLIFIVNEIILFIPDRDVEIINSIGDSLNNKVV